MHMKPFPKLLSIALFLVAVAPAFAQVVPAGQQGGGGGSLPIVVGSAYSNFTLDWGPGHRSSGMTAWIDVYPFPKFLRDVGLEGEARTSRWGNPIAGLREDTAQAGAIYSFSRWNKVHPYGKFLAGNGSMDFPAFPGNPNYKHDTFFVDSASGGAELKATGPLRIRAEYQYQWWHNVFTAGHTFAPNGITVGAQWDFRRMNTE